MSRRIQLTLVHHSDARRLTAARRTVDALRTVLDEVGDVQVTEIARQPPVETVPTAGLTTRHLRQWRLERRWAEHLGVGRRWFLSLGLLGVRMLQLLSTRTRTDRRRQAAIERILSAKHAHAWREAYERRVDLLVVLEDDALLKDDSVERFTGVLRAIVDEPRAYVDLAGGVPDRELRVAHIGPTSASGLRELERPSSNTTCAYLVGRETIAGLAEMVMLRPEACMLPADWVVNSYFLGQPLGAMCFHTSPSVLLHGSYEGVVASSIR